mmetsp:Transcript_36612/g.46648  ORF Transcript_36612/g.46648 Transcript_36612/m.46648 type:complete len:884 (-) Transcript_36612:93-2744(-)
MDIIQRRNFAIHRILESVVWISLLYLVSVSSDPISNPLANQDDLGRVAADLKHPFNAFAVGEEDQPKKLNTSYHSQYALKSAQVPFAREVGKLEADSIGMGNRQCPLDIEVLWVKEVGSSVYASPLIHPLHSEDMNGKQIVVSTFLSYLEMLEWDGDSPYGWPLAFEGRAFHGSPTLFDVDDDGQEDLCVVDTDGNILWIQVGAFGKYQRDYEVAIPPLRVRRDWFELINEERQEEMIRLSMFKRFDNQQEEIIGVGFPARDEQKPEQKRAKEAETLGERNDFVRQKLLETKEKKLGLAASRELLFSEQDVASKASQQVFQGRKLFQYDDVLGEDYEEIDESLYNWDAYGYDADDMVLDYRAHYYGYGGYNYGYGSSPLNDTDYVQVDAHVLSSPALADLNGDGYAEVFISVSYFYEENSENLEPGVDPKKFVAGGVVCYDLLFQEWSWTVHLDLTTDETEHRAYIYASPTVADLEGDGRFEVIVGTALGLVYVLDADTGVCRPHFPMQLGSIETQIAVADIHGDANLEMIVVDTQGHLVVVNGEGEVVWDKRVSGAGQSAPVVGDVNGDGYLDVVLATTTEEGETHLWAISGQTGIDLPHFPMRMRGTGSTTAPVLLVDLHLRSAGDRASLGKAARVAESLRGEKDLTAAGLLGGAGGGLHLVLPSFDGHVYVIEGATGCTNSIDIGEHIATKVLAEDVAGDGLLDLLVSTTGGEVIALSTNLPSHPLNTWSAELRDRVNGFTHGSHQGIYVLDHLTKYTSILSQFIPVTFEIVDERRNLKEGEARYNVVISRGTNTLTNLLEKEYTAPGIYTEYIDLGKPQYTSLYVSMWNEKGQYFEHVFSVAYNTQFHETLKWMIAVPFALSMFPLVILKKTGVTPLPA